jgi:cytoskeletal protein CcmA (bactofilin family)
MLGKRKENQIIEISSGKQEVSKTMSEQVSTILSSDTHFKGSLSFEKSLKIEGGFEGEINTSGSLYVGKDAKVKAEIKVGSIYIEGSVTGNVTSQDKVELRSTSRLIGDVKAAKLVVEEGATLTGHCEIGIKSSAEKESSSSRVAVNVSGKTPVEASLGLKL